MRYVIDNNVRLRSLEVTQAHLVMKAKNPDYEIPVIDITQVQLAETAKIQADLNAWLPGFLLIPH